MQGREGLNRAVDGDVVAVEIFAKNDWVAPSEIVLEDESAPESAVIDVLAKENELKVLTTATKKKKDVKPTGKVVGVIRRNWRQYCGILQQDSSDSLYQLFIPADKKIPKIRIETRQAEVLRNQKIIVAIDSWPAYSRYPNVRKLFLQKQIFTYSYNNIFYFGKHTKKCVFCKFSVEKLSLKIFYISFYNNIITKFYVLMEKFIIFRFYCFVESNYCN